MRQECRERFPYHSGVAIPTCFPAVSHVPGCMPGSLTSVFLWSRWRGQRSWHSRPMCNPQFYVSGKRPMVFIVTRYHTKNRHTNSFFITTMHCLAATRWLVGVSDLGTKIGVVYGKVCDVLWLARKTMSYRMYAIKRFSIKMFNIS